MGNGKISKPVDASSAYAAKLLRCYMKEHGLTLQALSRRMGCEGEGVKQTALYYNVNLGTGKSIENKEWALPFFLRVAAVTGIPLDELAGRKHNPEIEERLATVAYNPKPREANHNKLDEASECLMRDFAYHEKDAKEIIAFARRPAVILQTDTVQRKWLKETRERSGAAQRGLRALERNMNHSYDLRRTKFCASGGYGRTKFTHVMLQDEFDKLVLDQGVLAIEDRMEWLEHLRECVNRYEVSFVLIKRESLPLDVKMQLETGESVMSVGSAMAIRAKRLDRLPHELIPSVKKEVITGATIFLKTLMKHPAHEISKAEGGKIIENYLRKIDPVVGVRKSSNLA